MNLNNYGAAIRVFQSSEEDKPGAITHRVFQSEMLLYYKWNDMIPKTRFEHSTPGLLIKTVDNNFSTKILFMYLTQSGQIQISDFTKDIKYNFWTSCNGFLLETYSIRHSYYTNRYITELMITNPPTTNQCLPLPPFIDPTQTPSFRSAIAYLSTTMEYKVVRTYFPVVPHSFSTPAHCAQRINCAILTLGVDNAWRLVDTQHLSLATCQHFYLAPLVTEGFVHWVPNHGSIGFPKITSTNFVLTLNMETETITPFLVPRVGHYYYKYFSSGESSLSLLIGGGYLKWNVCEMKPETGGWTKLLHINMERHEDLLNQSCGREEGPFKTDKGDCLDCKLSPAGWLKYREVFVFVVSRPMKGCLLAVYNVQTQDITLLMLDKPIMNHIFHRNNQLIIPGMQGTTSS